MTTWQTLWDCGRAGEWRAVVENSRGAQRLCRTSSYDKAYFYGCGMKMPVTVNGIEGAKNVTARVLSFEKNLEPVAVEVNDGKFTFAKPDAYSAAFLVTFEND